MSKLNLWNLRPLICLPALLLMLTTAPAAHAQDGIAERIGAELDEGISRLSEEFRQGWESLQQTVDKMGIKGRVYSRLRWDKQLHQANLDVDVQEGGIVVLVGTVADESAKQKAVQLTQDTVGVNQVVDRLSVPTVEP